MDVKKYDLDEENLEMIAILYIIIIIIIIINSAIYVHIIN
jgi:hypothetical protein